jgi:hypothetical protein
MMMILNPFTSQRLNPIELVIKGGMAWSAITYVVTQLFCKCYNSRQTDEQKKYQAKDIIALSERNSIKALIGVTVICAIPCILGLGLLCANAAYFRFTGEDLTFNLLPEPVEDILILPEDMKDLDVRYSSSNF